MTKAILASLLITKIKAPKCTKKCHHYTNFGIRISTTTENHWGDFGRNSILFIPSAYLFNQRASVVKVDELHVILSRRTP